VIFVIFFILFLRSPNTLLNAQFWAEDGKVFFQNAYNFGVKSIFSLHEGYLLVFQRTIVYLTVKSGFYSALPFIWNFLSLLISAVSISLFASSIYRSIIPNKYFRLALSILVVSGGMYPEIIGNLANLQWFISLFGLHLSVLFIFENKIKFKKIHLFLMSVGVLLLVFSAPQALIYFPFMVFGLVKNKTSFQIKLLASLFFLSTAITLVAYLFRNATNSFVQLNLDNFAKFIDIIFYRYFLQNLLPYKFILYAQENHLDSIVYVLGISALVVYLLSVKNELKFLLFLGTILTVYALVLVVGRSGIIDQHDGIINPNFFIGGRYFFLPYVLTCLAGIKILQLKLERSDSLLSFLAIAFISIQNNLKLAIFQH